jgi:hypothetical protein
VHAISDSINHYYVSVDCPFESIKMLKMNEIIGAKPSEEKDEME